MLCSSATGIFVKWLSIPSIIFDSVYGTNPSVCLSVPSVTDVLCTAKHWVVEKTFYTNN